MFVLGLILILLAALLILAAVMGGADDAASFDIGSLELTGDRLCDRPLAAGGALDLAQTNEVVHDPNALLGGRTRHRAGQPRRRG